LVTANYMIGLPGETPEEIEQTLAFNDELAPDDFGYFVFYPYPGTKLFHICRTEGFLPEDYLELPANNRQSILNLPDLSKDDIEYYYNACTKVREDAYMKRYGGAFQGEDKSLTARGLEKDAAVG
jgi:anaerobic magnesium-protoporphyrin IX monomethyl ester cyclase